MITFKSSFKERYLMFFYVIIVLELIIFFLTEINPINSFIVIFILYFFVDFFLKKNLNKTIIDDEKKNVFLVFSKFVFKKIEECYSFNTLHYSYIIEYQEKMRKTKRFSLFNNDIILFNIGLSGYGWNENKIIKIIDTFKMLGIKGIKE